MERWVRAYPIGRVLKAMINNLGKREGLVGEGSTVNAEDMLGRAALPVKDESPGCRAWRGMRGGPAFILGVGVPGFAGNWV